MIYKYSDFQKYLTTKEAQDKLLKTRDKAFSLIEQAGAVQLVKLIDGDSHKSLAVIDRLVELGELVEIEQATGVITQDRFFTWNRI